MSARLQIELLLFHLEWIQITMISLMDRKKIVRAMDYENVANVMLICKDLFPYPVKFWH